MISLLIVQINWMLIYNITTKVEHQVHAEWLQWMQKVYVPTVMESGYFDNFKLSRLLGVDEEDGVTSALQFIVPNRTTFQLYQQHKALEHQTMHATRYREQALCFRTVMDVVDHG